MRKQWNLILEKLHKFRTASDHAKILYMVSLYNIFGLREDKSCGDGNFK